MANSYGQYSEHRVSRVPRQQAGPSLGSAVWQIVSSYRPHKHPRITVALLLWVFGLLAMFALPAPDPLTPEKMARYEDLLLQVNK